MTTHQAKNSNTDQVKLKLIFVPANDQAGKEFFISPHLTASEIAQYVFENWPPQWEHCKVDRSDVLKLIYQGRFLHEKVTLSSLNIQNGRCCVMHLVPREKIPEPNIDSLNKEKCERSQTGCCMCSIL